MSGLGRRTHYRKHLTDSILYDSPEPGETERIAKVVSTRGGNQFDILLAQEKPGGNGEQQQQEEREAQLAILPTKFNKLVWVKRNDFVIVETGDDDEHNNSDNHNNNVDETTGSIRFIISHILYKDQVKHLQSKKMWPVWDSEFVTDKLNENPTTGEQEEAAEDVDDDDDDDGIVYDMGYDDDEFMLNTNRVAALKVDDSSDSSDEGD